MRDWNCAKTTLHILGEVFDVASGDQVLDAALGMHGAGRYGAQCGLLEGALMFLGVLGGERRLTDERIVDACHEFARQFEGRFGSLLCKTLRPAGFHPDDLPHLCEDLTCDALALDIAFVSSLVQEQALREARR
jgi:hypothetical protein